MSNETQSPDYLINSCMVECTLNEKELLELNDMELLRHLRWLRSEIEQFSTDSKNELNAATKKEIDDWLFKLFTSINLVHKEFDRRKITLPN